MRVELFSGGSVINGVTPLVTLKNPFEKWETFHVYSRGVVTNITMHLGKFVLSTLHPIFPPCLANHFFAEKKSSFSISKHRHWLLLFYFSSFSDFVPFMYLFVLVALYSTYKKI